MKQADCYNESLAKKLLLPTPMPGGFKREKPPAFRFQPYSRKVRRRLDVYTPIMYDLWVGMEWDPSIKSFNERVEKTALPAIKGEVYYWAPRAVSISNAGDLWAHSIADDPDSDSDSLDCEKETFIKAWADANQVNLKVWAPQEIRRNPVELANRKQLYAYLSNPETVILPALRDQVLGELRRCRKTTLEDLALNLGNQCRDSVLQAVADLIMVRDVFSDIHKFPVGWSTEISCFHEFP